MGEGPEEALYRSLINEYELEKNMALHPFTKEVQEYYAHSSIYVLSSRWRDSAGDDRGYGARVTCYRI